MLKDRYGRTIDYMRVSITDRCNLRCGYCMPEGFAPVPAEELLSYEEIAFVCAQAAGLGVTRFKLTGGEPLVRKDCAALVKMIKAIPDVQQVTLTTNGVLLEKYLDELLDAGLDAVNVSLDAMDRTQYRAITGMDALEAVLASVHAAAGRLPVKLNCVVQRGVNGDSVEAELPDPKRPFTAAVITLSDKGYSDERADESGPAAREMLEAAGYEIVETLLLPDEPEQLKAALRRLADQRRVELIVTSGGTGFSPRDRTPEATLAVADRNAPGIAEYIRMRSMAITPRAMLGRGVSVIRGGTLIVNLPGSPRAVRESLGFILDALPHGLEILRGTAGECARKEGGSSK